MTEAEWLKCDDPEKMLRFVRRVASERKLRLLACACCRRIWDRLPVAAWRQPILTGEQVADGVVPQSALKGIAFEHRDVTRDCNVLTAVNGCAHRTAFAGARQAVRYAPTALATPYSQTGENRYYFSHAVFSLAQQAFAALIRDIFGPSFGPVAVDSGWLTPTVVSLAKTAYTERELPGGHLQLDRLAILADALEEASCTDADILNHLRGPGVHVRGCWALDLVLGKQ